MRAFLAERLAGFANARVVRFGLVGVVNTVLDIVLFMALVYGLGLFAPVANTISYGTGIVVSFVLNRRFTFNDRAKGKEAVRRFAGFAAVYLAGLALSTALVALFILAMPEGWAKLVSVPIVFVWNYFAMRYLVFRASLST